MAEVIMPKMGDAMEEGVIVQFLKRIGDTVGPEDAVLEIETDKSNVEVPAGAAGVVHEIRFAPGSSVPVGTPVVIIGDGPPPAGATAPTAPAAPAAQAPVNTPTPPATAAAPSATKAPIVATVTGANPLGETYVGALPEGLGGSASVLGEPLVLEGESGVTETGRIKASPLARAMAAKGGVSLASLRTDGPVRAADVQAALSAPAT
ncbi:MAG: biotin/lipoyl-containing protein, partial [Armatimonadota bacterium]